MRTRAGATVLDPDGPNAIAVMNGVVGDEWTLWILHTALTTGITQYSEWMRAGPISSSVLTARLERMVEAEILERVPYTTHPPRHHYPMTSRGRQMWPILLTIWAWERRWVGDRHVGLPRPRHTVCGQEFAPQLVCDACGEPVGARDVHARPGPSGTAGRSTPPASTRRRSHDGPRPGAALSEAMDLLGNRWSAALLGAVFLGAHRFGEFEQRTGAPPTIVADRVRTFCELGVLAPRPNPQRSDWAVYHLTDKGRDFYPFIVTATDWAQRWFHAPDGPAVRLRHLAHNHAFRPRLACDQCGLRLRGSTIHAFRPS